MMKATYLDADFRRAMDIVGTAAVPSALATGVGIDWDYLAWLGIGVAEEILGELGDQLDAVANGAEAFTAGFLIGIYLPARATGQSFGMLLSHAVDEVRNRGRHAIIADYCDLESVARFEEIYAEALIEQVEGGEHERAALLGPVTTLFESGLASGLALHELRGEPSLRDASLG
jgi:hypothetical protein